MKQSDLDLFQNKSQISIEKPFVSAAWRCALCRRDITRFEAVRAGDLVEDHTGNKFICPECFKNINEEKVNYNFIGEKVEVNI